MSMRNYVVECPWCHHTDPGHVVPVDVKWKNVDMNQIPRTACQTAVIVQAGPKMKMAVPCGCTKSGVPQPLPEVVQQPLETCARPGCDNFCTPGQLFCSKECVTIVMRASQGLTEPLVKLVHKEDELTNGVLVNEIHEPEEYQPKHAALEQEIEGAVILHLPIHPEFEE